MRAEIPSSKSHKRCNTSFRIHGRECGKDINPEYRACQMTKRGAVMSERFDEHMDTKAAECAYHGMYVSMFIGREGGFWTECPLCAQEESPIKVRKTPLTLDEERVNDRAMLTIRQSGVPDQFLVKTFDSFETGYAHAADQQRAFNACRSFADRVVHGSAYGEVLSLYGSTGTGKTHLSCSVIRQVALSGTYRTCLYVTSTSIVTRASAEANGVHSLLDLFAADLLVIDDIGSETSVISPLLERRRRDQLPTILVFGSEGDFEPPAADDIGMNEVKFFWPAHRKARRRITS